MPNNPITPAPEQQSVVSFPTPQQVDRHLMDRWSVNEPDYLTIQPGAPHPRTRDYPGFVLLKQMPTQPDDPNWVWRVWHNGYNAQATYNYEIEYEQGANAYPVLTREYLELREQYQPRIKLSALSGIYGARSTAGGNGYTQETVSAVISGTGSGCALLPVVVNGAVTALIVMAEGTGWTGAPTITILDSGKGSGATAVPLLQASNCLLTKEKASRTRDENDSLYLRVERTYETLPGPEIIEEHFDTKTATDQFTYTQRVAIGTKANPVSSIKITGVAIGTNAAVGLDYPHGFNNGDTFPIRIAGVKGSTPAVDGDYTATATGSTTLTIPLHVTVAATANTGYLSFLKGVTGQVIIDSYVKPDDDAGSVTGTLITVAVILPGRESSDPEYNEQRGAFTDKFYQYVVTGTSSRNAGAPYKGKTIEVSNCADPFVRSNLSHGPAMALLVTETITLPGDPIVTALFEEQSGASQKIIQTRVALSTVMLDAIGSTYFTSPDYYVIDSKVREENVVTGVLTTLASELPPSRIEAVPGSEPMPRIFTFVSGWVFSGDGYQIHGPFLGVAGSGNGNYNLELHAPATPLLAYTTYTLGRDLSTVSKFAPLSGRSRFVPIDGLTLHDTYALTETTGAGTQTIEEMFASTPAPGTYAPGNVYIITLHERPWRGGEDGIWERQTIKVVAT